MELVLLKSILLLIIIFLALIIGSLLIHNLKKLVDDVKYAYSSRGFGFANERCDIQQKNIMRRRIIFSRNLNIGHILTIDDLKFRRANEGIFPSEIYKVLGKEITRDVYIGKSLKKMI